MPVKEWDDLKILGMCNSVGALPSKIGKQEGEVMEFNRKIDVINKHKKELEAKEYIEVSNERNDEGKAVYSNDKMRESEMYKRLSNNKGYEDLANQGKEALKNIHEAKVKLEVHRNELRSYSIVTDLLKIRWRIV